MTQKKRPTRTKRIYSAQTADRHELYQLSVQAPEGEVEFMTRTFRKLMSVVGREDLADDPRFSTMAARGANAADFFTVLNAMFARDTRDNWLAKMHAVGIPAGPVATVGEALTSRDAAERGLVSRIPHPVTGWVPHVRPPFRLSLTPVVDPIAAPAHGQHTREVLSEVLGYGPEELEALQAAGVFGPVAG